eukprot:297330_1
MVSTSIMQHQKHITSSKFENFFCSIQWTFYFLIYIMDKVVKNNIIHAMVMKLMWNGCKIIVEFLYGSKISSWYKGKLRDKKYYRVGIKEETCGTEGTQREGKRTYKPETRHEREGPREGKETPKGEETYEKQST